MTTDQDADAPYELNHRRARLGKVTVAYASAPDTCIEIFWKDFTKPKPGRDPVLDDGVGPVISFILADHEVTRFDCLGERGHFHLALARPDPNSEKRLWFRERTSTEQVQRAIFELRHNLKYYQGRNPVSEVRSVVIDDLDHERSCNEAEAVALNLIRQKQLASASATR